VIEDAQPAGRPPSWPVRLLHWPLDVLRTLLRVIPQAVDGFFTDRCTQHAAGIAYRVLFSLVPLSIVLVAIFGLVLRDDSLRDDVITEIVDRLPLSDAGSADVTREIERLATPATGLGLVSLLVFAWAATGMMASLRAGLEVAMHVPRGRPAVRGKLVDLILIIGAAALVMAVVIVNLATQLVSDWLRSLIERLDLDGGLVDFATRNGAPLLLTVVVVLLLYRFVPARRLRFRDALAGSILTGVLFLVISLASGYIYGRSRSLGNIYGSLTLVLVFLYSVYLYASALLLGAEVAAAWSRPTVATSEPLKQQIRRAVLGLFVRQDPPAPPPTRRPRVPTDPR
jgi:membrane protein